MEKLIPYSEWPKWVKIATATNTRLLTIKEPKKAKMLSGFNIGAGFFLLLLPTFINRRLENMPPPSDTLDVITMMIGFLSIIIGIYYF